MAQNPNYRWQRALPEYTSAASTSYGAYSTDPRSHNPQAGQRNSHDASSYERSDARGSYALTGYSGDTISPTALYQHQSADQAPSPGGYQGIAGPQPQGEAAPMSRAFSRADRTVSTASSNSIPYSSGQSRDPRSTTKSTSNSDDGYVPDSKRSSTDSGSAPRKKAPGHAPRKRVPASCTPCRKKKLRCNRSMPCSSCVERGEPDGCLWEGDATPLYTVRNDNDLHELRAQVDRLQSLLNMLTKAARSPSPGQPSPPLPGPFPQASAPNSEAFDDGHSDLKFDLAAQDLCAALSELALNGIMPPMTAGSDSFAPGGSSGDAFIEEAKRFLQTFTFRAGLSIDVPFAVLSPPDGAPSPPDSTASSDHGGDAFQSTASPAPIISPSSPRPTMDAILPLLPTARELRSAYDFYAAYVHWYCAPVSLTAIEARWPAFKAALDLQDPLERAAAIDPLFLAMVLGIGASGLASMTNKQAKVRGFAGSRTATVEKWVRAASLALLAGKFVEEPQLDGIRAAAVIASFYVFMTTGETISAGMSLLSLAVHAAFDLGLNRDPVQNGHSEYSFREREERRRAFWCLFALSMTITTGTGRIWSQFDLRYIDCKFPLDCEDGELEMDERAAKARVRARFNAATFQETSMTSSVVRAELALLVKKITDKAFGISPCSYSDVLELDQELVAFEMSLPAVYILPTDQNGRIHVSYPPSLTQMRAVLINLCYAAEMLRVHRPFLMLAATDSRYEHSRSQCLKYAKRILAINATPGCRINWAGHNVKVISAAIVLGVDLLQKPGSEEDAETRALIDGALQQTETFASVSSVCRKGGGVMRFLLQKIDANSAERDQPRRSKRSRTGDHDAVEPKPLYNLGQSFTGFDRTPADTDEDNEPRRRVPARPPLVQSASDTAVPQYALAQQSRLSVSPELLARTAASPGLPDLQGSYRPDLPLSGPATPTSTERSFSAYSTAPVGRQIAGLGRGPLRQARAVSKLSIEDLPTMYDTTRTTQPHSGPRSASPQYYMSSNAPFGSTTPAGPPPSMDDSGYPFFPLPPQQPSGMPGPADFDFLSTETDIDRHFQ